MSAVNILDRMKLYSGYETGKNIKFKLFEMAIDLGIESNS